MEKTEQTQLPMQNRQKLELSEQVGIVEAILFVTGNAVEKREICRAMEITEAELNETLDALESGYDFERRGLRLLRFGSHVQLATRPDYAPYVEKLLQPVQKQSLSQAIMETLAVIAGQLIECAETVSKTDQQMLEIRRRIEEAAGE